MLRFCNTNVYMLCEVHNEVAEEIWVPEVLACSRADADEIYKGVKLKFYQSCELDDPNFFNGKHSVALGYSEFFNFVLQWYLSCYDNALIRNCVPMSRWVWLYENMYQTYYENMDIFPGALSYYEALALHHLSHKPPMREGKCVYYKDALPEFSWMLADYLYNPGGCLWDEYLSQHIRENIKDIRYKARHINYMAPRGIVNLDLNVNVQHINEVDFTSPNALFYFINPFNPDFKTNNLFIEEWLSGHLQEDEEF